MRLIGEGGFGAVYEAVDLQLRRPVAIKVARGDLGAEALIREAQALAAVRYPGLVQVHCIGMDSGVPYMVMELLRGTLLADHLDQRLAAEGARLTVDEVLEILLPLANTLVVIHGAGFAHRDVKPENVMLCPHRVVLVDLGLALPEYAADKAPMIGTPEYMAPEIIDRTVGRGQAYLTDIYALGVLAFELFTGETPFVSEKGALVTLQMHLLAERPSVTATRPDVPAPLDELITHMMAISPHERPPSMEAVVWELTRAKRELGRT